MAFFLVQGGSTLYKVDPTTGTATGLTLPTGVTLDATRKPRFAVLNQWVAIVNSPTRNLIVDPEGVVRVMTPRQPSSPPTVAAGSGTGLTGAYLVRESFVVLGTDGTLYTESPLSSPSTSVTVSNKDLSVTQAAISTDTITLRRLYRTSAGGTLYYRWLDLDGNTVTSFVNNLSDAGLALLPAMASTLVAPAGTLPGTRMKQIASWRGRLWGVADDPALVDTIVYSEDNKVYAWPNSLNAYPIGQDSEGVVAFAPRRNQLGVLKRNGVWQITGTSSSNFAIIQIAVGNGGCVAPDSVCVINDKVYWLGKDGVYAWSDEGIVCISDEAVSPWFQGDTYFNRNRFANAFAKYNMILGQYELHLAAAGASTENRWVVYNVANKKWYGPNKTDLFTPSHAAYGEDANNLPITLVGGTDGIVYTGNASTLRDGASTAIDMDVMGPFHNADAPDIKHYWGELSMISKIESGGTLTITPYIGRLDASAGTAISHSLTTGRERLRRLGVGDMARLRFQNSTVNQNVTIYGYELPWYEVGRR